MEKQAAMVWSSREFGHSRPLSGPQLTRACSRRAHLNATINTPPACPFPLPQYHKKIKDENGSLREELGRLRIEAHRTQVGRWSGEAFSGQRGKHSAFGAVQHLRIWMRV